MTTECLELRTIDRGDLGFAIYSYGLSEDIGIYKTEERAKEVLQEIVNYASISSINDSYQVADLRLKLAKCVDMKCQRNKKEKKMEKEKNDYKVKYEEEKKKREKIEKDYITLKEKTDGINKKIEEINKKNEETNNKINEITKQNQSIAISYQALKQEKEDLENGIIKALALIGKK